MRFGLSLPMQHPVGDDMSQRFAELLEMVRLARQAGFAPQAVWTDAARMFSIHGMIAV